MTAPVARVKPYGNLRMRNLIDRSLPVGMPLYAHPPTQLAPVASKSVEDCMLLADEYAFKYDTWKFSDKRALLQAAIVAYGDAQWNEGILKMRELIGTSVDDVPHDLWVKIDSTLRGLKR